MIPLSEKHLRRIMKEWISHYNHGRPHSSLGPVSRRLLAQMQVADLGLRRLEAALEKTGLEPLAAVLQSMGVRSLNHVDNLDTLHKIVLALEAKAAMHSHH